MKQINFRKWQFQCDVEATRSAYNQVSMGSADKCNCEYCQNYLLNIDKAFPPEILFLFEQMGIDYTKEAELYNIGKPQLGLVLYNGWLHFIGHVSELLVGISKPLLQLLELVLLKIQVCVTTLSMINP